MVCCYMLFVSVHVWLQYLSGPTVPISVLMGDIWLRVWQCCE